MDGSTAFRLRLPQRRRDLRGSRRISDQLVVRARAFAASMLSPLRTLFALFVVFTAAQVWNDNDRASAAVAQEASTLRTTLILATAFPAEPRSRLERLIHSHIEEAATKERSMMSR